MLQISLLGMLPISSPTLTHQRAVQAARTRICRPEATVQSGGGRGQDVSNAVSADANVGPIGAVAGGQPADVCFQATRRSRSVAGVATAGLSVSMARDCLSWTRTPSRFQRQRRRALFLHLIGAYK